MTGKFLLLFMCGLFFIGSSYAIEAETNNLANISWILFFLGWAGIVYSFYLGIEESSGEKYKHVDQESKRKRELEIQMKLQNQEGLCLRDEVDELIEEFEDLKGNENYSNNSALTKIKTMIDEKYVGSMKDSIYQSFLARTKENRKNYNLS